MAIIRTPERKRYSAISNKLLQDNSISFGCRGMMGYLLSKPDNWEVRPSDIEKAGSIGRDARRALMVEAERAGYLTFHTGHNKRGRFESWYNAHEEPVPEDRRTQSWETGKKKESPGTGFPDPADPESVEPGAVKPEPVKPGSGKPGPAGRGALQKKEVPNTDKNKDGKTKSPADAGKGGKNRRRGIDPDAPEHNWLKPYLKIFDEEYRQRWGGAYVFGDGRDFKAVKDARNTYEELFTEELWRTACRNYIQSPPPTHGHKVWHMVGKFALCIQTQTDRFGQAIEETRNETTKQSGASTAAAKGDSGFEPQWRDSRVKLG